MTCPRSHRLPRRNACSTPVPPGTGDLGVPPPPRCPPPRLVRVGPEGGLAHPGVESASPAISFHLSIFLITEKKICSHFLYSTFPLKKNVTPTPSVPSLQGEPLWPRASISANHLANRKFQRPRHICVLSAFSG